MARSDNVSPTQIFAVFMTHLTMCLYLALQNEESYVKLLVKANWRLTIESFVEILLKL